VQAVVPTNGASAAGLAVSPRTDDPALVRRYLDLAWRREGDANWRIRDGLGNTPSPSRLAAASPLVATRLEADEERAHRSATRERWIGIGAMVVSPLPLLGLTDVSRYRVRDDDFIYASRGNDALAALSCALVATGATLTVDSLGWRNRLERRRTLPSTWLSADEADSVVRDQNATLRGELGVTGEGGSTP
jgi:hypothetical protein